MCLDMAPEVPLQRSAMGQETLRFYNGTLGRKIYTCEGSKSTARNTGGRTRDQGRGIKETSDL